MIRLEISGSAVKHLSEWLEQLLAGEIELWELPAPVAAFYFAGESDAAQRYQHEIARLEREINRISAYAHLTDKQQREHILERLAKSLTEADEQRWQQLELDLRAIQKIELFGIEDAAIVAGTGQINVETGNRATRNGSDAGKIYDSPNAA